MIEYFYINTSHDRLDYFMPYFYVYRILTAQIVSLGVLLDVIKYHDLFDEKIHVKD